MTRDTAWVLGAVLAIWTVATCAWAIWAFPGQRARRPPTAGTGGFAERYDRRFGRE